MKILESDLSTPNTTPNIVPGSVIGSNAHPGNGFDLLRLVAAIMVLYGHSAALTGSESFGLLGNAVSTIGVKVFFVISGFLITKSWMSDPSVPRFVLRRALRIIPGLVLICLLTAFLLGPLFTSLPLMAYFTNLGTWRYFWNIALFPIYNLPGVFDGNPYPVAVNGSLWSLPAEVAMYVLVPVVIGRTAKSGFVAAILWTLAIASSSLWFVWLHPAAAGPVRYGTSLVSLLDAAPYFQAGVLYALFKLDRFGRPAASLLMMVIAVWLIRAFDGLTGVGSPAPAELLLMALLPFAVISIGTLNLRHLRRPLEVGDFSYGLYLYGFPIQQALMVVFANRLGSVGMFALSLPLTTGCAVASWFLVERRALSFKPRRISTRPEFPLAP